uniref:Uncharacterized protein n=1 Tax=Onchocerca volvulus TaxID=6282 RepID=A0A8R1TTZ5_ONCVO
MMQSLIHFYVIKVMCSFLKDWKSGFCFQSEKTKAQPGSIDSEAGIFAFTHDRSGFRLFTLEADKSIKMYKEDEEATEKTYRSCKDQTY